jgi:hypothetical protein
MKSHENTSNGNRTDKRTDRRTDKQTDMTKLTVSVFTILRKHQKRSFRKDEHTTVINYIAMTHNTLHNKGRCVNKWCSRLIFYITKGKSRTYAPCCRTHMCCCITACLPASRRGKTLVGENTLSLQLPYNIHVQLFGKSKALEGTTIFLHYSNLRPWPFVILRSITMTVKATKSSDRLKHGFRDHRIFTTEQQKQ